MFKLMFSVVGFVVVLIVAISWFLSPDNLMDCGQKPSDKSGCQKADVVIAVSGGDTSARAQEAIDLYENGWASRLIFSGAAADTSGPSNAAVMRSQAIGQGVPESAITIEQQSKTTEQNASKTSDILSSDDIHTAIVVTSAYHMKRTVMEFRLNAPHVTFRSHPVANDDQWSSAWWWTTPNGWYLAVSEIAKIVAIKAGDTAA